MSKFVIGAVIGATVGMVAVACSCPLQEFISNEKDMIMDKFDDMTGNKKCKNRNCHC